MGKEGNALQRVWLSTGIQIDNLDLLLNMGGCDIEQYVPSFVLFFRLKVSCRQEPVFAPCLACDIVSVPPATIS